MSFLTQAVDLLQQVPSSEHNKVLLYLQSIVTPKKALPKEPRIPDGWGFFESEWIPFLGEFEQYILSRERASSSRDGVEYRRDLFVKIFTNKGWDLYNASLRAQVIRTVLNDEVRERYIFPSEIIVGAVMSGNDKCVKELLKCKFDRDDFTSLLPRILHFQKTILVCLEDPRFHNREDLMNVVKQFSSIRVPRDERSYYRKIAKKVTKILAVTPKYDLNNCPWYEVMRAFE